MSQKKVEEYKEYKKNREKINKKEERAGKIRKGVVIALAVVVAGWLGFSIYNSVTRPATNEDGTITATELDYNEYYDYLMGLESTY